MKGEAESQQGKRQKDRERQRERETETKEEIQRETETKRKATVREKKKRIKIKAETKAETSKHIQRMRMIRWKHRDYKGNQSQRGTDRQKGHRSQLEGAAQIWEDVSINTS